ncbi:alpha/beta fold hydrolase [Nocardia fluminea]|uniref:Pimeloyl-ACP methyl ester carboxylesterase n=1 Tax=Nocardia fluminea TaxID=134984 RepID=A0A2N3WXF5_9NOCA|nr:alpha/beta hydrolase [Nocardia fluminea]PKV98556.1 pimeloyl-ACP methyl ester carboxylesterase [Nocardia fluminea]
MSAGAVAAGGPGLPKVVLIHGLAGSYRAWDRVVPKLEHVAQTVAVELDSSGSIGDDADDVAALLDSRIVVVGHSRGGLVATALAERRPDLVSALVLLCPPWSRDARLTARGPVERALALPAVGDLMWALASGERQRAAQRSAFAPGVTVPDRFVADARMRGRRNFVCSSQAIDTYLGTRALADRLRDLTVPTELVFGHLDARLILPTDEFTDLGHVRTTVLAGSGHTPQWEAAGEVADLITRTTGDPTLEG